MSETYHYMLRKTLVPWRMDETIQEVLNYCLANKILEVIWKIETEQFNRGFTTARMIRDEYLEPLQKAKALFDKAGVITSINPWMTLNHGDAYGLEVDIPGMGWMVGHDGRTCRKCACPMSEVFVQNLLECYALYAGIRPRILWVEDDFRNFNHSPVEWGCFCDRHLERFSKRVGRPVIREELVERLLKPGKPDPWRAEWMEFLGDVMVKLAGRLCEMVEQVSPETCLGLMTSHPEDHSIEGRKWHLLIKALSGRNQAVVRPHFGCYRHTQMRDIFDCADILRMTVHCLPPGVRICPELENAPFTEYVKSVRFTRAQINLSAGLGYSDITMNLYDHCGTPLDKDDVYGRMLRGNRAYLDSLLEYCRPGGTQKGIGLVFHPESARHVHTKRGRAFPELWSKGLGWSSALQSLGFAVTFEKSGVYALTGQAARGLTDERINEILSCGVLLDASAARVLIDLGYGKYLGVDLGKAFHKIERPIAGEDIGGGTYISPRLATQHETFYELRPEEGTQILSRFVDPERNPILPAMTGFENCLGGRVCVYSMDLHEGTTCCFLSRHRQKQMKNIMNWLSQGRVDLFVGPGPDSLPLRIDYTDYSVIVVINNSPDTWESVRIESHIGSRNAGNIFMLSPGGDWETISPAGRSVRNKILELDIDYRLEYLNQAVFCIRYT